ncbi:MAG TPA: hypothetical protein VGX76_20075 [Pirellulales bacterium]|jgi:hypothetical protein|nr:hypothetical protein [Pirellulales bacterium]
MPTKANVMAAPRSPRVEPIQSACVRCALVLGGLALELAGLIVCTRRWAGAVTAPLDGFATVAIAIGAALAVAAGRVAWLRYGTGGAGGWRRRGILASPGVGLFLLLYGLSLPDTPSWAKLSSWTLLFAEEAACWWWIGARRRAGGPGFLDGPRRSEAHPSVNAQRLQRRSTTRRAAGEPLRPHEQITQRMVRSTAADGSDVLRGSARAELAAGSMAAKVHVAFCPPFATLPRLELGQSAGPPARIGVGQILPQGARIEVRLDEPARRAVAVWLEFEATAARGES